ncbi:MAG: DUF1638 domain-containing protein [Nitrospinae bacterium]|nr:DUF1638 domain-containing protein [Nitrospinota bacterium]
MAVPPFTLIACGVLQREIVHLVEKNRWPARIELLPPSLHNDVEELERRLVAALDRHAGAPILLYYGHCHPLMEELADRPGVVRMDRENCVASLLGDDSYFDELGKGTYFLLEEWAKGWREAMAETFGDHPEAIREIFTDAHRRMVALVTPVSGDYATAAHEAARQTGLPLEWRNVDLSRLEEALAGGVARLFPEGRP